MGKEKNTDMWVHDLLTSANIKHEADGSDIKEINEALKTASKRNTGKVGKPEFICVVKDFLIVIEDKASISKHIKLDQNDVISLEVKDVTDYAVNGAYFYGKHLFDNTSYKKIIAFGVSGNSKKHKITPLFIDGTEYCRILPDVESFISFNEMNIDEYYIKEVLKENTNEEKELSEILKDAAILHEDLRNYGNLKDIDKPLIVSGILLALREMEYKNFSVDNLTGDAKTGYVDSYETNETTDDDGTTTKNIIITNTHSPDTTQKKVKKVWNDDSNKDGIRPKSVKVNLLADGKVEETLTLSAENRWQASSKILPVKVDGKKVNYTWEEVKEDLITGESEIGYKPSYDTDTTDQDLTLITNFHDRTEPKGSVTITKALDPGNLNMDVGDPSFTFTLSGTDVYGKKHSYVKQIKFTKAEVEKQMKDHPGDPIELSVTFDNLEYGTYTCDEGGMLKYFKLKSLTSDSSNATIDQKKGTVTFEIGPVGTTAKAQLKGTAKFTNQMIQGSIKLVKKDSNGRVLKDVEFVIHSSDGAQVAKAKTDAAGEITFDGLIPDTYTITETKTKEGKTLLREPITATIPLTMSQAEVDKQNVDTSKAIRDGNTYYFYHLTYEVSNDARLDLPKTGGWTDYLPLAGGVILILGGLFMYYRKKRRKM